ncbi:MAG: hypothetical protein R2700_15055 [Solirubrobacterales bacterium]
MLADPSRHREAVGRAAEATVAERYALDVTFPEMAEFYEEIAARGGS